MLSTKTAVNEARLRHFFHDVLVPIAQRIKSQGIQFFPVRPDDGSHTWYIPYDARTPELVTVEADSLEADLQKLWGGGDHAELAVVAGDLARLAREFESTEDVSEEVSPLIYAMF